MTNYGNTGQRYRMSTFAKVESYNNGSLLVTLDCGHSYTVPNDWFGALPMFERYIAQAKRTRCNVCVVPEARP